ncbi:EamA family transporter RarD [Neisseriaceae bacterium B1]
MSELTDQQETKKGFAYALGCYLFWGTFPVFWYPLNHSPMPAEQIMAHRVLWSAVFAFLLLIWFKKGSAVLVVFRQPKLLSAFIASALLIGANWLIYLWAIVNNRVLDASLGYFINPLFNILLGFIFFKERLNWGQLLAVSLAVIGILWLAIPAGQIPWIALLLALTFGSYALVRKLAPINALPGIALETFILLPLALAYLAWCGLNNTLVFQELSSLQLSILFTSGAATTIPLLLFTAGAQRISMSLLGMLQYLSPSLQLMWGVVLFGEILSGARLTGYMWVWAGVAVFLISAWRSRKK